MAALLRLPDSASPPNLQVHAVLPDPVCPIHNRRPNAFTAFDLFQLALIPLLAFFVYELVKNKNFVLAAFTAVILLVDPLPSILMYSTSSHHNIRLGHARLEPSSVLASYYGGYSLGNAHILQAVLLVGALYFGFTKKPWLSALLFAFGTFDPRAALIALPLLVWYNRQKIIQFSAGAAVFVAAMNLPFFFYYGIG